MLKSGGINGLRKRNEHTINRKRGEKPTVNHKNKQSVDISLKTICGLVINILRNNINVQKYLHIEHSDILKIIHFLRCGQESLICIIVCV